MGFEVAGKWFADSAKTYLSWVRVWDMIREKLDVPIDVSMYIDVACPGGQRVFWNEDYWGCNSLVVTTSRRESYNMFYVQKTFSVGLINKVAKAAKDQTSGARLQKNV